jgi:hypothetical protein
MAIVRLEMSLALACDVALPVNVTVATVELVLVTSAVKPVGTFLTIAPAKGFPAVPV